MGANNCCFYRKKSYSAFNDSYIEPYDTNIEYDTMLGQEEVITFRNNYKYDSSTYSEKYEPKTYLWGFVKFRRKASNNENT